MTIATQAPTPRVLSRSAGVSVERCDLYGSEKGVRLLGGIVDPKHLGNIAWYCGEKAIARYRLICKGGYYGYRRANDGGAAAGYHCPGGHSSSEPMPLCKTHALEGMYGPPAPGFTADLLTPVGQVGGTVWNKMCTRCVAPPEARSLMDQADRLQAQMSAIKNSPLSNLGLLSHIARMQDEFQRLEWEQDTVRARLDELRESGRIHNCGMRLVEVS